MAIKTDNFRMKKEFFLFDFVVAIFRKNLDVFNCLLALLLKMLSNLFQLQELKKLFLLFQPK